MTRVAAIVPMRHNSERVPGKNYRLLGGMPLYRHVVHSLRLVPEIDEIVIDTDSPTVMDDAREIFPDVTLLSRPEHLRDGAIAMNDVLLNTLRQIDVDVVLQTHSTNPFLSAASLQKALHAFAANDEVDSVFGVTRLQARLWSKDTKPVNHDPALLLRTQDLDPIYLENSCFYVFTPHSLAETGNRLGPRPMMVEVPAREAIDIDDEWDFRVAEAVASLTASEVS